jgi:hypothetical protein
LSSEKCAKLIARSLDSPYEETNSKSFSCQLACCDRLPEARFFQNQFAEDASKRNDGKLLRLEVDVKDSPGLAGDKRPKLR